MLSKNQSARGRGEKDAHQPPETNRGQIRGIRGMVERDAYCTDILTQSAAVSAAVAAFSRKLLETHIKTCVCEDVRNGRDDTVDELIDTLQKFMK